MKIGYHKVAVTPPIGVPMAGYAARKDVSKGVHDELYARCIVLRERENVFALVSHDLIGVSRPLYRKVLEKIKDTGLSEENLAMTASHTHSGPVLTDKVVEDLAERIAGCIKAALLDENDVNGVYWAVGDIQDQVINRRDPEKGPVDPRLHVVKLEASPRSISVVNVTAHAVVLGPSNLLISADYPGALVRNLEQIFCQNAVFLQGCCGDINPVIGTAPGEVYKRIGSFEDVEKLGKILAYEAARRILAAAKEEPCFDYVSAKVDLDMFEFPDLKETERKASELREKLEEARRKGDIEAEAKLFFELFEAERILYMAKIYGTGGKLSTRIYALKLSKSSALVFLPGEVLVKIGLEIKSKSPFPNTIVVAYTNDYLGYVPPAEEYDKGGYEARFPVTILKKGCAEKLIEEALKALNSLK